MSLPTLGRSVLLLLATALAGCAGSLALKPPEVPAALQPPADQVVYLEALATGVQIYECAPKTDQPDVYEWVFRAPEATLADRAGKPFGKHYAGPTWASTVDLSLVVGAVKARDPGPDPSAIPWLLLGAESTSGAGVFARAKSIQRVRTAGGLPPAQPCTAATATNSARVPYTATYYFYR